MIAVWSGNLKKGLIGIHEINGVIHRRTGFKIKQLPFPSISYAVTKFTMVPESLLIYYMIIDKSASAWIPL
jgi:hypothetical protein